MPALFVSLQQTAGAQSGTKKPNFLVILTDDQGYRDLGCFGHPAIKTPNLDKMVTEACVGKWHLGH